MAERKVLLDQWSLSEPGSDRGLGRYAFEVRAALENQSKWQVEPLLSRVAPQRSTAMSIAKEISKSHGADLYHALTVFHLPPIKKLPWICSIQDIIPLDLADYRRFGIRTKLAFLSAQRSDLILANSTYTADRVMSKLNIPAHKIEIASLPISSVYRYAQSQVRERHSKFDVSNKPIVVALADDRTKDPRKRYHWIDQLAASLNNKGINVVVAGRGIASDSYPNCTVIDSPSDSDLAILYQSSLAFFYPSSYEGQGLPPIEAMASGLPVLAFRNSSITEMVGDGGFLFQDPHPWSTNRLNVKMPESTVRALVDACIQMVGDPLGTDELKKIACAQAGRFTRSDLQRGLLFAYDAAIKGASR